jgi:hypothetical protein
LKLVLEISGGLLPTAASRRHEVDTAELPQALRAQVEELVNTILAAPRPKLNPAKRDARSYELTIRRDGSEETVTAEDGSVPAPFRSLVTLLTTR